MSGGGSGARSATGSRNRPRYLVPRELLQRMHQRGLDRIVAAARQREGFSNFGALGDAPAPAPAPASVSVT